MTPAPAQLTPTQAMLLLDHLIGDTAFRTLFSADGAAALYPPEFHYSPVNGARLATPPAWRR